MDSIVKKATTKTQGTPFLPDELIINILRRLPPKSVARCRLVCRRWKDLTLPRDFVDLIFRNSIPTILVTNPRCYSRLDVFPLDKWGEPAGTKVMIHRFPFCSGKFPNTSRALFSHAGLIVLQENPCAPTEANFTILNPARPSREFVRITLSKQLWKSKIYGVYFHPLLKECCTLWMIDASDDYCWYHPKQIPFKILNLGSNPFLRTISNPFSNKLKLSGASPLFINNHLYWLLESLQEFTYSGHNDIMEFDIICEELMIIPCPVPLSTKCKYFQTRLLNIDGILSFLLVFPTKITIWRLEDHAEQLWSTSEYTLSIDNSTISEYTLRLDICIHMEPREEIVVVDGKLAVLSKGRLLVYNLKEGTMKNYPKRKYNDNVLFLSHQMSLASLDNCKTAISIDLDDKVVAA